VINKNNNYAFIDSQNLNLGIKEQGWSLDFKRFRVYLREKYGITKAFLFIGYIPTNQSLYTTLQSFGYILVFKPTLQGAKRKIKGNVDADLVLQAVVDYYEKNFDKAVIVTSDGDFYCLVKFLYQRSKLEIVMSPYKNTCSSLLKKTAKEKIIFMDNLRVKLEYKKKNTA